MDHDPHDADACEICGSNDEIGNYQLDGRVVIRCREHQGDGICLEAERIYWERRLSQLEEIESNDYLKHGIRT